MTLAVLSLLVLTAAPPSPAAPAPDAHERVRVQMRASVGSLTWLEPYLVSSLAFRDPSNEVTIRDSIKGLSELRHVAMTEAGLEGSFSDLFADEVDQAQADFGRGEKEVARVRLNGLVSLCAACHGGTTVTKDYQDEGHVVEQLANQPEERAKLFAATRQFEKATQAWGEALAKVPANGAEAAEQSGTLRLAVITLVGAEARPDRVLGLVAPQLGRADFPGFFRRDLKRWVADLEAWKREPIEAAAPPAHELVQRARALLATTHAAAVPVPDDQDLVPALRAAAWLRAALEREPKAEWRGDALYLLALATAVVGDPALWQLDAMYLEACVRENPGTPLAVTCGERLSERMRFAYTGVQGGALPAEQSSRVGAIKQLATRAGPSR